MCHLLFVKPTMKFLLKSILLIAILFTTSAVFAQENEREETASQKRMAEMMATSMDDLWDIAPTDGTGNIQIHMK